MISSVIHRVCNTDNFSLPSYLPTERHSTLSVLNTIFSVHSLQCVIFHAHTHHPIVATLTAHIEGTTGCITQKLKKSQLPAQQQEGLHRVFTGCEKCHLQHKEWRGAQLGCVAQERRGGSTCGGGQALVDAQGRTSLAPCGGEKNAKK